MTEIRHVVFDLGQVLVHWDPEAPYRRLIPDAGERRRFLAEICNHEWNLEQDRGRTWDEGEALLKMIQDAAGNSTVIAEDLGMTPKYVPKLLTKLGIPGFLIPHFSVDPELREYVRKGDFREVSIATWGTHDHQPLVEWYHDLTRRWKGPEGHEAWLELQRLMRFLGEDETPQSAIIRKHEGTVRIEQAGATESGGALLETLRLDTLATRHPVEFDPARLIGRRPG